MEILWNNQILQIRFDDKPNVNQILKVQERFRGKYVTNVKVKKIWMMVYLARYNYIMITGII